MSTELKKTASAMKLLLLCTGGVQQKAAEAVKSAAPTGLAAGLGRGIARLKWALGGKHKALSRARKAILSMPQYTADPWDIRKAMGEVNEALKGAPNVKGAPLSARDAIAAYIKHARRNGVRYTVNGTMNTMSLDAGKLRDGIAGYLNNIEKTTRGQALTGDLRDLANGAKAFGKRHALGLTLGTAGLGTGGYVYRNELGDIANDFRGRSKSRGMSALAKAGLIGAGAGIAGLGAYGAYKGISGLKGGSGQEQSYSGYQDYPTYYQYS